MAVAAVEARDWRMIDESQEMAVEIGAEEETQERKKKYEKRNRVPDASFVNFVQFFQSNFSIFSWSVNYQIVKLWLKKRPKKKKKFGVN